VIPAKAGTQVLYLFSLSFSGRHPEKPNQTWVPAFELVKKYRNCLNNRKEHPLPDPHMGISLSRWGSFWFGCDRLASHRVASFRF
ncbi:MAG: hypothetical protein V1255_07530, partial [Alphaproteobacteria bacterium]|nr:hypothetical protein [Alphaproteobacteria bacterium]